MQLTASLLGLLALLAALPAQKHFDDSSFSSLFDGETLDGWVTKGGRYDGAAAWTVEDGAITGREAEGHKGGLLYTAGLYESFIFVCDVKISHPFDSGVFLRMVPRGGGKGAQVTLDYRPGGEVGAIYADGFLEHNKTAKDKLRRDDWNHLEVRCVGRDMQIQVWLNGKLITDYAMQGDSKGYARAGRIGLQVHGGRDDPEQSKVQFKNIRIRELPTFDPELFLSDDKGFLYLTPAGKKGGWKKLFDGKSLEGWRPKAESAGVRARDGLLQLLKKGTAGWIRTVEKFKDYELRLDFKITRMANSGIFLRGSDAKPGCELQILDEFHWQEDTGSKLKPWQHTGSLYAAVPPGVKAHRPVGRWNSYHILYQGTRLRVELNGQLLYDLDLDTTELASAKGDRDQAPAGFIGIQRHAPREAKEEVYAWFRNIFVHPLEARPKRR